MEEHEIETKKVVVMLAINGGREFQEFFEEEIFHPFDIIYLFKDIAKLFSYINKENVAMRDGKIENLLFIKDLMQIVIIDFNVSLMNF